jgi:hypothetical protein
MDVGRIMMRAPRREKKRREEKSLYLLFNTSAYLWGVPWKTNDGGRGGRREQQQQQQQLCSNRSERKTAAKSVSRAVQRARCDRQRQTRPTPPPPPPTGSRPAVFYYYYYLIFSGEVSPFFDNEIGKILLSSVNSTNFANFLSYFSSKFRYEKK